VQTSQTRAKHLRLDESARIERAGHRTCAANLAATSRATNQVISSTAVRSTTCADRRVDAATRTSATCPRSCPAHDTENGEARRRYSLPGPARTRHTGSSPRSERSRRVILLRVNIDAIDEALDVMLAEAAEVMADRSNPRAGIGHEVSESTELRRPTRVVELPAAPNDRLAGQLAQ